MYKLFRSFQYPALTLKTKLFEKILSSGLMSLLAVSYARTFFLHIWNTQRRKAVLPIPLEFCKTND